MSVIIHRTRAEGFTMLPNDLLRDPNMSGRARGVLVTLLSHEDGWQQSATYTEREMTDGRDSIRTAIRELTALGYIMRQKRQGPSGRWLTDLHVYDTPGQGVLPQSVRPTPVRPVVGDSGASTKNPEGEEPLDEEPKTLDLASRKRDALFEAVAEVCGIDWQGLTSSARGALNKSLAQLRGVGATPEEVHRRAPLWPYDVPLTPPGLAKHWPALGQPRPVVSGTTRRLMSMADRLEGSHDL